ncbi:MAG TPA: hypothetical protein ENN09_07400 [Planctomycetes bacterium]|nr:hypothetical protein [Planctomycetota bacterium]
MVNSRTGLMLAAALLSAALMHACGAGEADGGVVVARVNNRPIMLSHLHDALVRLHGHEALECLIYREALKDAMQHAGFAPSPEDLAHALEEERRSISRMYKGETTLAEMARRELGMTEDEYASEVLALRLFLRSLIVGDGKVTETELLTFYAANAAMYEEPPRVRISHILIRGVDDAGRQKWDKAEKVANAVLEKALAGEDFSALARRFSEDAKTATRGGDLGFADPDAFEWGPGIIQHAYAMREGEVAGPVRSLWGFHVVRVLQKIPGIRPDFDKIRDVVLADYLDEKVRVEAEFHTRRIVERAKTERYLDDYLKGSVRTPAGRQSVRPAGSEKSPGGFFIKEE